ncbi:GntR family transcriptional regulator [Actinomadura sp. NBRC 104425]|uniref:GntR family transcriptional regulator n=1 Tax=Actinomadura sp. NBRC 104425 TaxID=3032204 RepID=UPI0024A389D6|nr:GntR family transcriptional regulator [Actinomadura sp. NBRC 104425]GLZ15841.1 GntR family transcriptional regulator [Actinomadura sp. NBRC 104425]
MSLQRPRSRYQQVADDLREAIRRGTYGPGAALPSQPELARKYGLTQTSINRAIALLESEGLIRTERGIGSFVLDIPTVKRVRRIPPRGRGSGSSFAEGMQKAGLKPSTKLVQVDEITPPPEVAERLDLATGERVLIRKRHMFADDRPVQLATSYVPMSAAGDVSIAFPDTGPNGLYERLAERGHRVVRFMEEIESRRPTEEEADFLKIGRSQHVLEVIRFAFDRTGKPLDVVYNVFPCQLWKLTYEWAAEE